MMSCGEWFPLELAVSETNAPSIPSNETSPRPIIPVERSPRPIDPGVDIGHVHLRTADIERVHRFYVGILGFDVTVRGPDVLFVSAGGYHHTLGFNTWGSKGGPPPPRGTTGLYHVAIRYPTRAALGDALARLVEADWPLDGATDHGTHEALYLRDPDGNGLELYWDRPQDQWPLDDNGHLAFISQRLDLRGLLADVATRK
jgi:catechol 2,3-dioxygenase